MGERIRRAKLKPGHCKYLKEGCKEEGARLFSVVPSEKTRDSGHKLKHRRFPLNLRKHFLTVRVTEHCHRLPREDVELPSLEICKSHKYMVLANLTPMDVNGGADIHLQPMEDPMLEQVDTPKGGCDPGTTLEQSVPERLVTPWKGPMLEQLVKNCSPLEGFTLEEFVEDCLLWEGLHDGAGEECEESSP
ncbi:hypothetical protein QYF61_024953 [Mycteria americana]|uniref:Uncharacterized protein n=1 Tax=Mycteria americana TaxID=33587 RepID=A0AAN7SHE8_MYCAM|nr:hypothetical protein QYF61_024953 [Mycteria americana]